MMYPTQNVPGLGWVSRSWSHHSMNPVKFDWIAGVQNRFEDYWKLTPNPLLHPIPANPSSSNCFSYHDLTDLLCAIVKLGLARFCSLFSEVSTFACITPTLVVTVASSPRISCVSRWKVSSKLETIVLRSSFVGRARSISLISQPLCQRAVRSLSSLSVENFLLPSSSAPVSISESDLDAILGFLMSPAFCGLCALGVRRYVWISGCLAGVVRPFCLRVFWLCIAWL